MTNKLLKVEGYESLVRDLSSGAIINNSKSEYNNYISYKKNAKMRELEIKSQSEEIKSLKQEIFEIKSMLNDFLSKQREL